ncbi:phage SPO1 DNA polymerase-related protein [Methylococcus capsulatus str. Bath]|uniref:Type-4 uracil-DNA glycosylase n=1 Tax=Methylococcus capsulatus (strain ATCC 33009 / NCIMB 11132 / Bath) TaxID=243233 RepID=Q605K6_METCA|nr:uracil-DNA glycosylase [Methylococcus capsulatus]AAU91707.1 phage SPO1 DNA polymerase-related protein [Methylococcus capsulatus str. Bath]
MCDDTDLKERRRIQYLDAMGIPVWKLRSQPVPAAEPAADAFPSPPGRRECEGPDEENWDRLAAEVAACTRCELHLTRTQTVFGVGNRRATWMVIGEAPGEQEDLQGEPFVGRAGQLLNEMLRAIGLKREEVYIANILKCRPPRNRDPKPEEAAACESYLKRQIALIRPRIILAAGRIAAQNLLKSTETIGKLRGRVHRYENIPLVITYHPAYLLRAPLEKRKAWQDLLLAVETLNRSPVTPSS